MAFTIRKKSSSSIFNIPSYLPAKKSKTEDKVNKIIQETIKEKIFNLLNINRRIYIKLIEYFPTYTLCPTTHEKSVASFNLRMKNAIDKKFKAISSKEIELSGITIVEFDNYLRINNAREYNKITEILEKI